MLRLAGIILLAAVCAMMGMLAAGSLKNRVKAVRQIRIMLERIRLMIRYEALEVNDIVRRLSDDDKLSELRFIPLLHSMQENGEDDFHAAWDRAVDEARDELTDNDIALLKRTGSILGSCDCEGQLAALAVCCDEADRLAADAQEQYNAKGKLYRSLGAVAGALIAVIAV